MGAMENMGLGFFFEDLPLGRRVPHKPWEPLNHILQAHEIIQLLP